MNYPRVGTQQVNFADIYNMEKGAQANAPLRQLIGAGGEIGSTYLAYKKEQQKKADIDQLLKDYREGTGTFAPTLTEEQKANAPLNIDITERMVNQGSKMPTLLGISSDVPKSIAPVDLSTGDVLDAEGHINIPSVTNMGESEVVSLDKNLMGLRPLMNPNAPQIPTTPQPSALTDAQKDQILFKKLYDIDPARAKFELDRINSERTLKAQSQKKSTGGADIQKLLQSALKRTQEEYDYAVKTYGVNSQQALQKKALYESLMNEQMSDAPNLTAAYTRVGLNISGVDDPNLVDISSMRSEITNMKPNEYGQFDDLESLATKIEEWRVKNSIPVTDPSYKDLLKQLDDKRKIAQNNYEGLNDAQKQAYQKKKDIISLEKDYKSIYNSAIEGALTNVREKSAAINLILRDETGAAIGADETRLKVMDMLNPSDRSAFLSAYSNAMTNYIANLESAGDVLKLALAQNGTIPWNEVAGLPAIVETYTAKTNPAYIRKAAENVIPTAYLEYRKGKGNNKKSGTEATDEDFN